MVKVSRWFRFVQSLGRVNSPVVQNAITRQSKASVICPTELSRKSISQFETGLLAFCYSNSTPFNDVFLRLLL